MKYTDTQDYDMAALADSPVLWARGKCSFFGGADDPMDSGSTASGFSTKEHPDLPYVALPKPVRKKYSLPWGCRVTVENSAGEQVRGFLADSGPAKQTGRQIDLSPIFNKELGIETDQVVKFYVNPIVTDPRWKS